MIEPFSFEQLDFGLTVGGVASRAGHFIYLLRDDLSKRIGKKAIWLHSPTGTVKRAQLIAREFRGNQSSDRARNQNITTDSVTKVFAT